MSFIEGFNPSEKQPNDEYFKAAAYEDNQISLEAYQRAQGVIHQNQVDISIFRIRYEGILHVVALGLPPSEEINGQLMNALRDGQETELPLDIKIQLYNRRSLAHEISPWVEAHYRPGKKI